MCIFQDTFLDPRIKWKQNGSLASAKSTVWELLFSDLFSM